MTGAVDAAAGGATPPEPVRVRVPALSLVVLVGASGSGKSTFARRHFLPTEIVSSDICRGIVADDETDQAATPAAFEVLEFIVRKRLAGGRLTVVDATNVQAEARAPLLAAARDHHVLPVAIVLDLPERVCHERNRGRPDREFGAHVVHAQRRQLRAALRTLQREGFRQVSVLRSVAEVEAAVVERQRMWTDRRDETGPFDIIGDVHGCFTELVELLRAAGYEVHDDPGAPRASHPAGRRAIFLGDLVDRGPASPAVLRLVMDMVRGGHALCVPGNHDVKLVRKLRGRDVRVSHGLAQTLEQLAEEPPEFHAEVVEFLDGLVSHYVLDGGRLVVAHAGLRQELQGRASGRVREFALYGETTGETDEYGLPVRYDWAADYRGPAAVVYGHTPTLEPEWVNGTMCVDTGCVFGGKLTALRWPEKEVVQVAARHTYYAPLKPLAAPAAADARDGSDRVDPRPYGDLLDVEDVSGKRVVQTRVRSTVTIRAENAAAALEVMSRFAADPRWLVYLPPTMSPSETCAEGDLLEHPREALAYYRGQGVAEVVCQEKHMGSRAVVIVCRDAAAARRRFGIDDPSGGIVYTRTGRRFFADAGVELAVLARLRAALDVAGWWQRFASDWFCFDAELLPWSAKGEELLREQYAPVGAAARAGLEATVAALRTTDAPGAADLLARTEARLRCVRGYVEAYGRYCWTVRGPDDLRLAPFHVLASEGRVHVDADHLWHMTELGELAAAGPELLRRTDHRRVVLGDGDSEAEAERWWQALTAAGGEGIVVKPRQWLARGKKGLLQPAMKCRGREYLRIIYGPEYTAPEHLDRLRGRGLAAKRSLALREFALGLEGLWRFVEREPLYRVHECVFGVLALESEPVDPRL